MPIMKLATTISTTLLLLSSSLIVLPGWSLAEPDDDTNSDGGSAGHALGRHYYQTMKHLGPRGGRHRPAFRPGPWKKAHATFYEGNTRTYGGACDYTDVVGEGYGMNTAALSNALFRDGRICGACFQIECVDDPQWCKPGQPPLLVTATDLCPPNPFQASDNGGWCNPPREHFDIAMPVFDHLAEYKAGIIPVQYRRVPCRKRGGIRFTMNGNQWFYEIIVSNVGGAGDIVSVQVKVDKSRLRWTSLDHDWGATWKTGFPLQGKTLSFRVKASDGRYMTSMHVVPSNWQFGQTFEGRNFKSGGRRRSFKSGGRRRKSFGQL